jgi:hypothetical protein
MGFKSCLVVDCEREGNRRNGGLALLSVHYIDTEVYRDSLSEHKWRFARVSGWPEIRKGEDLEVITRFEALEWWCCIGEFNEVLYSHAKQGGLPRDFALM